MEERREAIERDTRQEPALGRVWGFIALLAAVALGLYVFHVRHIDGGSFSLTWWLLVAAFFVSEGSAVELPFKDRSHSFSLGELPLTIGVFLLDPTLLIAAVLIGGLPAMRIRRGIRGIKLVFNAALLILEVNVAYSVFEALAHTRDPLDVHAWMAAFAAAAAGCWVTNAGVSLVIALGPQRLRIETVLTDLTLAVVTGATNACLAIIGVALVEIDPAAIALMLIPGGVLLLSYLNLVQRRHIERQLQHSELRFRALVQNFADVVAVIDEDGRAGYVSPSVERMLGMDVDRLLGVELFDVIDPADRAAADAALAEVLVTRGGIETIVARGRHIEGDERWLEVTMHNLTHDPAVEAIVVNLRDITARKRAEDETRESEERLQSILDHANAAVFIKDLKGRYQLVNKGLEEIYQRSKFEILGHTDNELWPEIAEELRANDQRVLESLTPVSVEETIRDAGGSKTYLSIKFPLLDAAGDVTGVCGISTDITEAKRIEERLVQSEKMQAVGQLAGGIAHDFNNLLAIIQNYARFIIDELPDESEIRADAEEILTAGTTAAALTRQLLAFSRKEVYQANVVDLNEVIRSTCRMLRSALPETIDLALDLDDDLANVRVDTGRMEQVVMNLAINARDAMERGGELRISTRTAVSDADDGCELVAVRVSDTGGGIPDDVLPHIFEPFFTTKARDQGTGLGLASVYGIVEESGGRIEVESVVGAGTTFTVLLPACSAEADRSEESPQLPSGDGYRILVAEDERGVRNIAERILSSHGYEVVTACSGQEAHDIWAAADASFDLLLADVIMPGMSGKELSGLTGLPTLFMSGYTDRMIGAEDLRGNDVAFIPKPFKAEELLAKVAETVARVKSGSG